MFRVIVERRRCVRNVSRGSQQRGAAKHLDLDFSIGIGGSEQVGQVGLGALAGVEIGLALEALLRSGPGDQKCISKSLAGAGGPADSPADADLRLLATLRLALALRRRPLDDEALLTKTIDELSGGRRIDGCEGMSTLARSRTEESLPRRALSWACSRTPSFHTVSMATGG